MKKWSGLFVCIIVWSLASSACLTLRPKPPQPTPEPLPPASYTLAVIVHDQHGAPIRDSRITIQPGAVTFAATNSDGYAAAQVTGGRYTLTADTDCCGVATSEPFTLAGNRDVFLTVTRPAPAPTMPRIVTLAEDPIFKANFGSAKDDDGLPIFTPFLGAIWQDGDLARAARWLRKLAAEGCTYVIVQTESKPYRGYPVRGFDFRSDKAQFVAFLRWIQSQPAADGGAWRFLIHHTSGDNDRQDAAPREIAEWAPLLRPFVSVARMSMGFETFGDWKTINISRSAIALHEAYGDAMQFEGWGQPGRATAASFHGDGTATSCPAQGFNWVDYHDPKRPGLGACVEPDDPVQGDEMAGMSGKVPGLQYMTHYAFQFEHGRAVTEPCGRTVDDGSGKGLKYAEGCAMGRWDDVVARLGLGLCTNDYGVGTPCGWPILRLDAMETDTYDSFNGNSSPAVAERIANDADQVCADYGVVCGFGSGLPSSWRPRRPPSSFSLIPSTTFTLSRN